MIAIFIKEVRENLKWAALIALLVMCVLAFAVMSDLGTGLSLVGRTMTTFSVFAFPAAGFAMGLLSILPDARPGRWQFVMHRPIKGAEIFDGKLLAAAALYLAATLLPLLGVYAWAATPGHLPGPVTPDMLLPRLADLLGGLLWMSAGMFCASRSARWIGSRLMPVGFAFVVTLLAAELSMYFVEYLLIAVCGSAVMLVAARRCFIQGGELPRNRWITRTFGGLSLATGWSIAVGCAFALLASWLGMFFPTHTVAQGKIYYLIDDGTIAVENLRDYYRTGDGTDLAGRTLSDSYLNSSRSACVSKPLLLGGRHPEDANLLNRVLFWGFHNATAHLRSFNLSEEDQSHWFYVASRNAICGYDGFTHEAVGSLGPDGWSSAPQPFPDPLNVVLPADGNYLDAPINCAIVADDTTVWKIDFGHRKVSRIFKADLGDVVLDACTYFRNSDGTQGHPKEGDTGNVVVTREAIYLFKDGQTPLRIPHHYHATAFFSVAIGKTIDGRWMLDYQADPSAKTPAVRTVVFTDADGKTLQQFELPPLPPWIGQDEAPYDQVCEALAVPPGLLVGLMSFKAWDLRSGTAILWSIALCVGCLCCAITIPLARRRQYSAADVGGWAVLNLLLGIPGILLLLSMDDAVPTVRCESCGKPRPITQQKCPHCAADFAPPAKTGIEIFAAA